MNLQYRFQGLDIAKPNIYNQISTVGYQGFKSTYRPDTVRINHRKDPFFNVNALKPRIRDLNLEDAQEIPNVSEGFRRALSTKKYRDLSNTLALGTPITGQLSAINFGGTTVNSPHAVSNVPVSGYTGHRMGYRS